MRLLNSDRMIARLTNEFATLPERRMQLTTMHEAAAIAAEVLALDAGLAKKQGQ